MNRFAIGTLALVACTALSVPSVGAASGSDDSSFVQTAQSDALGQFALASAAQNKAQSAAVKSLASQIAANADKANKFIASYAKSHNVAVDNKPSLRATTQYGDISALKGKDFDEAFTKDIKIDASIALSEYQDEAQHGSDPTLKSFAKQQATLLEQLTAAAEKAGP